MRSGHGFPKLTCPICACIRPITVPLKLNSRADEPTSVGSLCCRPTRRPRTPMLYLSKHRQQRTIGFHQLIWRLGEAAKMPFPIHPHMLRHACGFKLANDGHDTRALQHYLGHKNIQYTVRYTEMAPDRFKDFWRD